MLVHKKGGGILSQHLQHWRKLNIALITVTAVLRMVLNTSNICSAARPEWSFSLNGQGTEKLWAWKIVLQSVIVNVQNTHLWQVRFETLTSQKHKLLHSLFIFHERNHRLYRLMTKIRQLCVVYTVLMHKSTVCYSYSDWSRRKWHPSLLI